MKTKKTETPSPALVDSVPALETRMAEVRAAQVIFSSYTQEQRTKSSLLPPLR